jgi:hypothetical protein
MGEKCKSERCRPLRKKLDGKASLLPHPHFCPGVTAWAFSVVSAAFTLAVLLSAALGLGSLVFESAIGDPVARVEPALSTSVA